MVARRASRAVAARDLDLIQVSLKELGFYLFSGWATLPEDIRR